LLYIAQKWGKDMRTLNRWLLVAIPFGSLIIGLGGYYFHRSQEKERLEDEEYAARERVTANAIRGLAATYNAVSDWNRTLGKGTSPDKLYSAELDDIFVRADGRPLLFLARLKDVTKQGTEYNCIFQTPGGLEFELILSLSCDQTQASQAMHPADSGYGRYAVIAQLTTVELGQQEAHGPGEEEEMPERRFLARGRCLALFYFRGSYARQFLGDFPSFRN
jgi:hypothetical protein